MACGVPQVSLLDSFIFPFYLSPQIRKLKVDSTFFPNVCLLVQVKSLITEHKPIEQFDVRATPLGCVSSCQRRMLGTGSRWLEGEPVHNPHSVVINCAKADYKLPAFRLRAGGVRTISMSWKDLLTEELWCERHCMIEQDLYLLATQATTT